MLYARLVARKTVREKMDRPAEIVADGKLLVPAPYDLERLIRKTPTGQVVTQRALREALAKAAGVPATCPLTTGIFLRLVALAAEEDAAVGQKRVAPWWRVVRDDGRLWDKSPGGVDEQARRLRKEGVELQSKRGVLRVIF